MEYILPHIIDEEKIMNLYLIFKNRNYNKPFIKDKVLKYVLKDSMVSKDLQLQLMNRI